MNAKQRVLCALAVSSLATAAAACGGGEGIERSQLEHEAATSGGESPEAASPPEAEATCGGGACGAVSPLETDDQ